MADSEDPVWGKNVTEFAAAAKKKKGESAPPAGDAASVDIEVDVAEWNEADLKDREWLVNGHMMRGVVTIIAGAPGSGKSIIAIGMAIACALGVDYGRFHPRGRLKVAIYNAEDDIMEQKRRISATLRQFDRTPRDLEGNLIRLFPKKLPELFHWGMNEDGGYDVIETAQWRFLKDFCRKEHIDVLFLDPAAELSTVPGNDNEAQRLVMSQYRALANFLGMAVVLIDHTPKNAGDRAAGDPNSVKGAGSKVGSSRIVLTCTNMTEDEARNLGISPETRHAFARITDAKHNYSIFNQPQWYEKVSKVLENQEEVGAAEPWAPPVAPELDATQIAELMAAIGRGSRGEPYSPKLDKNERSIRRIFQKMGVSGAKAEKKLLDRLFDMGLQQVEYRNATRNPRAGLRTPQGLPQARWWDLPDGQERIDGLEKAHQSSPETASLKEESASVQSENASVDHGLFEQF